MTRSSVFTSAPLPVLRRHSERGVGRLPLGPSPGCTLLPSSQIFLQPVHSKCIPQQRSARCRASEAPDTAPTRHLSPAPRTALPHPHTAPTHQQAQVSMLITGVKKHRKFLQRTSPSHTASIAAPTHQQAQVAVDWRQVQRLAGVGGQPLVHLSQQALR